MTTERKSSLALLEAMEFASTLRSLVRCYGYVLPTEQERTKTAALITLFNALCQLSPEVVREWRQWSDSGDVAEGISLADLTGDAKPPEPKP